MPDGQGGDHGARNGSKPPLAAVEQIPDSASTAQLVRGTECMLVDGPRRVHAADRCITTLSCDLPASKSRRRAQAPGQLHKTLP